MEADYETYVRNLIAAWATEKGLLGGAFYSREFMRVLEEKSNDFTHLPLTPTAIGDLYVKA